MAIRLRAIRKAMGISQTELAARTGIHRTLIARYEAGIATPSIKKLLKIASALGCTVDELIGEPKEQSA